MAFSRDLDAGPSNAGHLAAQELVLRLTAGPGTRTGSFELATRPVDPGRSADVCLRDDARRTLIVVEIWNRLGDLGAAARSTARKRADLDEMAILAGGDASPYRAAIGWLLTDTAANRRLVASYPAVFRAAFSGSSSEWVRCLLEGREPPAHTAVAWVDTANGRLVPMRIRAGANRRS